ncbi:hypothetical protein FRC10_002138 [Ceratobasidium sp. 414]|nr:hypothetical protein FRC10_002138 [Ceratobasidium sp. 414]
MIEACRELCKKLREPKSDGGEGCDIILALTHAEHFEDIELAKELYAYPSSKDPRLDERPGIDAVFGGHDHSYFLGEGVEAEDRGEHLKPLDGDDGLLIVKSGADFNDLSEVVIELEHRPEGTQRQVVVKSLKVIRHKMDTVQDTRLSPEQPPMENTLRRLFRQEVLNGLDAPIAQSNRAIKVEDQHLRSKETALGNWIADVLRERFESIFKEDSIPTVLVLTGASIRGGFTLEGRVLARQIIQLMPFEVSLTSLNLTGDDLWKSLDSALLEFNQSKMQPRMSTRFPVVSGLRLKWDSSAKENPIRELKVGDRNIDPEGKYRVVTSTYLAGGGSGFDRFKAAKENAGSLPDGPAMFQVVRDYIRDLQTKQNRKELHSYVSSFAQNYDPGNKQTADQDTLQFLVQLMNEIYLGDSELRSTSEFTMSAADTLLAPERVLPELGDLIPKNPDGRVVDVAPSGTV